MRKGNETELERRARIARKMVEKGRRFDIKMFIPARVNEPKDLRTLRDIASGLMNVETMVNFQELWSEDNLGEEILVSGKK